MFDELKKKFSLAKNKKGMFGVPAFQLAISAAIFILVFGLILAVSVRTNGQLRTTAVSAGATNAELTVYDNTTSGLQTMSQNTGLISTVIIAVIILALVFLVVAVVQGRRAE